MSNDIFYNLNMFIEDVTKLLNKFTFNHIETYNDFDEVVIPFFDKYEKKSKITKGIINGKKYKDLLEYKHKHLTVLLNDSTELSNSIQYEKHITENNLLDYMIKSIIDNRLIPILKFVVYELYKAMQSFETNDLNNAINTHINDDFNHRIFKKEHTLIDFNKYCDRHIIEPYIDYSYLFQRLKHEKLIYHIKHFDFMTWLNDEGYISSKYFDIFINNESFRSLSKSYSTDRYNNFNLIFNQ